MWLCIIATIVIGYFLGNVNGAVCISRLMKDDVRSHGSGNAGLTNFIRKFGSGKAVSVILIDGGKAVLSCLLGGLLLKKWDMYLEGVAIGGASAMLGHVFPVFLGFKGGKGILSGLFIALMVDWRIALLILAVFAVIYLMTQYVSAGSVFAALAFGVGFVVLHYQRPVVMICGIFMSALTIFMHRGNIERLCKGVERKTNLFQKGEGK